MARVESGELKLVDAAQLLRVSYRQAKRLGKRYREQGALGLKQVWECKGDSVDFSY